MRTIHCIAIDPDVTGDGSVGGVEWRVQETAIERLWMDLITSRDYDNCELSLFEFRVPDWASNQYITLEADRKAWFREYACIRHRGTKADVEAAEVARLAAAAKHVKSNRGARA